MDNATAEASATTLAEAAWATSVPDTSTEFDLEKWLANDDWRPEEEEEETAEEYFSIISPNWESALETWGKLWHFHVYFFGALFLLLLSQVRYSVLLDSLVALFLYMF